MFKAFKSLMAGLIAGTALGVLFSPGKGDDLRKKFKEEIEAGGNGLESVKQTLAAMGHDIGDTAKDAFEEFKKTEVYKQGSANFKKEVEKAKKMATAKGKEVKKQAQRTVKKAKSQAKKTVAKATKTAKKTVKKVQKKVTAKK